VGIRFVKARRIEDLEREAQKLYSEGFVPIEGGFMEETHPDTPERFIFAMIKKSDGGGTKRSGKATEAKASDSEEEASDSQEEKKPKKSSRSKS